LFEEFSDELMDEARRMIREEQGKIREEKGLSDEYFFGGEFLKEFSLHWDRVHSNSPLDEGEESFLFSPMLKRYVEVRSLAPEERVSALRAQWEMLSSRLGSVSKKTKKLHSKISLYNRGYEQRASSLQTQIAQLYSDLELTEIELACFRRLEEKERYAIDSRLTSSLDLVKTQQDREMELQERFDKAQSRLRALQQQQSRAK